MTWFTFALLSAVFAALTSILAKIGIKGVDSNLATAIRTRNQRCVAFTMSPRFTAPRDTSSDMPP